jgi:hypothetical protein
MSSIFVSLGWSEHGGYDPTNLMRRFTLLLALLLFVPCCGRQVVADGGEANSTGSQDGIATERDQSGSIAVHSSTPAARYDAPSLIRPLIDPSKLATLGDRGTNTRVQKITAILWQAKINGQDPAKVADRAVELIGWGGTEKGRLTAAAMVRNVTILERLGGTTPEDLENMRRGRTATVRKGPYAGEILSVDHIIPRAVAPELDNVIANLELMPLSVNRRKNDKVGDRQVSLAKAFHAAGLLPAAGFQRVMAAKR